MKMYIKIEQPIYRKEETYWGTIDLYDTDLRDKIYESNNVSFLITKITDNSDSGHEERYQYDILVKSIDYKSIRGKLKAAIIVEIEKALKENNIVL